MFDDASHSSRLSTAGRMAVVFAVPFIFLGIYFLFAPISEVRTETGGVFGCGSAIGGPDNQFKENICSSLNTTYLYRGVLSLAAGLVIAIAGFTMFRPAQSSSPHHASAFDHASKPVRNAQRRPKSKSLPAPLPELEPEPDPVLSPSAGKRQRPRTFD